MRIDHHVLVPDEEQQQRHNRSQEYRLPDRGQPGRQGGRLWSRPLAARCRSGLLRATATQLLAGAVQELRGYPNLCCTLVTSEEVRFEVITLQRRQLAQQVALRCREPYG